MGTLYIISGIVLNISHKGSQQSFNYGSVRRFDLFAAEAKWAKFNIIKCVFFAKGQGKNHS